MNLTDLDTLRSLLRKHGLWAKKSLGQHFLIDEKALQEAVNAADLSTNDTVIEIGPGCGVLTAQLAMKAGMVHAVELDEEIIPVLAEVIAPFSNVRMHVQDIRSFAPPDGPYKVVANIPYYLTGKILRLFLEELNHRPSMLVLMTQYEVAKKITSMPPHANLLSIAVHTLGNPEIVATVPAKSFYPVPKVNSAIIRITTRTAPADIDIKQYFRVVRAAFGQARKQIHNGLSANLALEPAVVKKWLQECAIEETRRPSTLTIDEWTCLTKHIPLPA